MSKIICAWDNGISGSCAIIYPDNSLFFCPTPVKKELNYTKTKKWINRLDHVKVKEILSPLVGKPAIVLIERPMVNPGRFQATISAIRCLEALLICLQDLNLPYRMEDSKKWQKAMLPSGLKAEELKIASLSVGKRLFPSLADSFKKDADSILMAEWARRCQL